MLRKDFSLDNFWETDLLSHCGEGISLDISYHSSPKNSFFIVSWYALIGLAYFLRGVVADSEDTIKASASALGIGGFINYYGLQVIS